MQPIKKVSLLEKNKQTTLWRSVTVSGPNTNLYVLLLKNRLDYKNEKQMRLATKNMLNHETGD